MNWYAYVGSNPVVYVDPSGLELFGLLEGEAAALFGVDLSLVLTIDFSHGWESGLYQSQGPAFSTTAGYGWGGGVSLRDIEGQSTNFDVNSPWGSGTLSCDNQGMNSIAFTGGPGAGAAWSVTQTAPIITLEPIRDSVVKRVKGLWGSLPWVPDPCQ